MMSKLAVQSNVAREIATDDSALGMKSNVKSNGMMTFSLSPKKLQNNATSSSSSSGMMTFSLSPKKSNATNSSGDSRSSSSNSNSNSGSSGSSGGIGSSSVEFNIPSSANEVVAPSLQKGDDVSGTSLVDAAKSSISAAPEAVSSDVISSFVDGAAFARRPRAVSSIY